MLELQKEIADERNREDLKRIGESSGVLRSGDNKKMEWMYKADKLNREEYLTGRAIDKHFENSAKLEAEKNLIGVSVPKNHVEHECIPFSIRAFHGAEEVRCAKPIIAFYDLIHIDVFSFKSNRQLNKWIYNEK